MAMAATVSTSSFLSLHIPIKLDAPLILRLRKPVLSPLISKPLSTKLQCFNCHHHHHPQSQTSSVSFLRPQFKRLAIVLLGSLLFAARFYSKPSLALAVASTTTNYEEMYARILERNPRDVEALKVALYAKMRKRKFKEAVELVERLIDVEPEELEWRLLRALCYEIMGQVNAAKKFFREILEDRPLQIRALHGLAMAMHKNHEGLAVFEMLCKALDLARRENRVTEERNIRILIAQMHVVKGNLEDALKQFQDLINENPRDFRPFLCQGIIYGLLNKKMEAEKQFEIYRSLVPEELPQRSFLDDVVLAAKAESQQQ